MTHISTAEVSHKPVLFAFLKCCRSQDIYIFFHSNINNHSFAHSPKLKKKYKFIVFNFIEISVNWVRCACNKKNATIKWNFNKCWWRRNEIKRKWTSTKWQSWWWETVGSSLCLLVIIGILHSNWNQVICVFQQSSVGTLSQNIFLQN